MTARRPPSRVVRRRLATVGTVLSVLGIVVFCIAPFYWMIVSSLKGPNDIFNNDLWPSAPTLVNYRAVFSGENNFSYALRNSVVIAGTTTLFAMVIGVISAYAFARLHFRGKRLALGAVLAASMFPGVALLTPLFQQFSNWGWIDQYQSVVIPDISFALPLAIWVLSSFFRELPWGLEESAMVDGASKGQAFRLVILPLAAPGIFTSALLVFISVWNEFLIANAMTLTPAAQPVTVAIAKFTGSSQYQQPFSTQMAAGVVVTVPLVILVWILQRRIVSGLTAGALKG
ncbi:carbohydrate ABC transporter permease [Streptomyces chiangmaiensis]|uniref:Carbohydrate ABC transporter permease n=1 Tax=Streptomyces chiangmaiensis TaxID=766497 RepID=A0ABU7FRG5_9ACTN|nr:carbohydrate ABC transporter permease [Streptomyces chiangmaiensis]MED7826701.1 carbohydrate ABC transporter permease [Streptomyces chiangmaiensis]